VRLRTARWAPQGTCIVEEVLEGEFAAMAEQLERMAVAAGSIFSPYFLGMAKPEGDLSGQRPTGDTGSVDPESHDEMFFD
jgi:hypothetical protein